MNKAVQGLLDTVLMRDYCSLGLLIIVRADRTGPKMVKNGMMVLFSVLPHTVALAARALQPSSGLDCEILGVRVSGIQISNVAT